MNTYEYSDPLCSLTPREVDLLRAIERHVEANSPPRYTIKLAGSKIIGSDGKTRAMKPASATC